MQLGSLAGAALAARTATQPYDPPALDHPLQCAAECAASILSDRSGQPTPRQNTRAIRHIRCGVRAHAHTPAHHARTNTDHAYMHRHRHTRTQGPAVRPPGEGVARARQCPLPPGQSHTRQKTAQCVDARGGCKDRPAVLPAEGRGRDTMRKRNHSQQEKAVCADDWEECKDGTTLKAMFAAECNEGRRRVQGRGSGPACRGRVQGGGNAPSRQVGAIVGKKKAKCADTRGRCGEGRAAPPARGGCREGRAAPPARGRCMEGALHSVGIDRYCCCCCCCYC